MVSSKTFPSPEWKELMRLRVEMLANSSKYSNNVNVNDQKMTFDVALKMVNLIIDQFGLEELR